MWVITFKQNGKRLFICEGECGYPYVTDNYILNHFSSANEVCRYLDLLDEFDMWKNIHVSKSQVRVAKVTFNLSKNKIEKINGNWRITKDE